MAQLRKMSKNLRIVSIMNTNKSKKNCTHFMFLSQFDKVFMCFYLFNSWCLSMHKIVNWKILGAQMNSLLESVKSSSPQAHIASFGGRAVVVVRNPYKAILSYWNFFNTKSHTRSSTIISFDIVINITIIAIGLNRSQERYVLNVYFFLFYCCCSSFWKKWLSASVKKCSVRFGKFVRSLTFFLLLSIIFLNLIF